MRADPAVIAGYADTLDAAAQRLASAKPVPGADAGPSTAAISATMAEIMEAAAGLAEVTVKTADDLHQNKTTYASTEDENVGRFGKIDAR